MTADDELVECLICGGQYRSLGHHVRFSHGISADDYRDQHGIRRYQPLTALVTHERFRASIVQQIEAGHLAAHYATNADRGPAAWAESKRVKRELRAKGATFAPSRKPAPRAVIEAVVAAVLGGEKRSAALANAGISQAAFYVNLKLHPDLKARLAAAYASPAPSPDRKPTRASAQ